MARPGRPRKNPLPPQEEPDPFLDQTVKTGRFGVETDVYGFNIVEQSGIAAAPDLAAMSDRDLVRYTLRAVMCDPNAPAAARAQAARTMAEATALIGARAETPTDPSKPVGRLSREELERELAAVRGTPSR